MKLAPDYLFVLIKSLTKTEKRYIKIFASQHTIGKENNYIKLFDAIDAQKNYDEEKIKAKFKHSSFISRISSEKVYLYKLVLKALRVYHSANKGKMQVIAKLEEGGILWKKGLLKDSYKAIKKAESIANKSELLHLLPPIYEELMEHTAVMLHNNNSSVDEIYGVFENYNIVIDQLKRYTQYWMILQELISYNIRGVMARDPDFVKTLEQKYGSILDDVPRDSDSYKTKWTFYRARQLAYHLSSDLSQCITTLETIIQIAEEGNYTNEYSRQFIYLLNDVSAFCILDKNNKLADKYVNKYRQFFEKNYRNQASKYKGITTFYYSVIIFYQQYQGDTSSALKTMNELNEIIGKPEHNSSKYEAVTLYYMNAYANFCDGNLDDALSWINRMFNNNNIAFRRDIHSLARILNIIIHFELENYEILPYQIQSAYRFLLKLDKLYPPEKRILDFIRKKLIKNLDRRSLTDAFKALHEQLKEDFKDSYTKQAFVYLDLQSWLESKIHKKDFKTILKEKYLANESL